ncbi:SLOG family protein [Terribacillus goriensis]|uniref:SLOG family protein n=1 Tax=Terribacillus saccharophilus TaxID=361277 RepID=UPI003983312D
MKNLYVTGYKHYEMGIFKMSDPRVHYIKQTIRDKLIGLIETGLEWVLLSGQTGVELWAAQVVLDLKEEEYDIQLAVIPPFDNQDARWSEDLQEEYQELIMLADFYQPIYEGDYKGPYQFKARDKWMLSKTEGALVMYDENQTGSIDFFLKEARSYQKAHDYELYYITALDLQDTLEREQMNDPSYWDQT